MVKDGKAPDIAQIGAYADYAAKDDALYSADELLSVPTQANFLSQLADAGKVNRIQYGLPFVASTRLLFYNKKLLRAGGSGRRPRTWDDIKSPTPRRSRRKGVKTPFALPLGPEEAQAETMMWTAQRWRRLHRHRRTLRTPSTPPENVATLTWLRDNLVSAGLTGPVDPAKLDRGGRVRRVRQGRGRHAQRPSDADAGRRGKGVSRSAWCRCPARTAASKSSMGVADWIMALQAEPATPRRSARSSTSSSPTRTCMDFVGQYDLLPTTYSANDVMSEDPKYKDLAKFQTALPTSQLPPVDKTSWGPVSEEHQEEHRQGGPAGQRPVRGARPDSRRRRGSGERRVACGGMTAATPEADDGSGPAGLTDRDRAVLAVERRSWPGPGAKERAIREQLAISPTRYYQVLNTLLDDPRALAHDPVTVNRLRRVRETRRGQR